MWRAFFVFAFLVMGWAGCASAGESLYQTTPPSPSADSSKSRVFIAPYITRVETTLTASISQSPTSGNTGNTSGAGNMQKQAATAPNILYADILVTQIQYSVGCNLKASLNPGDRVTVTGMTPDYFSTQNAVVVGVSTNGIVVATPDPIVIAPGSPDSTKSGGAMTITVNGKDSSTCPPPAGPAGQPITVSDAHFLPKIRYWVSCDLTSVLHKNDDVTVKDTTPSIDPNTKIGQYDTFDTRSDKTNNLVPAKVFNVKPGQVIVIPPDSWSYPKDFYKNGGAIAGSTFDICPATNNTYTVALTVTPAPLSRGYLYLRRNPFFDDNVNVSVGGDGLLTNSDTSSTQEITAILTELAQTAALFEPPGSALMADYVLTAFSPGALIVHVAGSTPEEKAALTKRFPSLVDVIDRVAAQIQNELANIKQSPEENAKRKLKSNALPGLSLNNKNYTVPEFSALSPGLLVSAVATSTLNDRAALTKRFPSLVDAIESGAAQIKEALLPIKAGVDPELNSYARAACYRAIADLVKPGPFYATLAFEKIVQGSEGYTKDPPDLLGGTAKGFLQPSMPPCPTRQVKKGITQPAGPECPVLPKSTIVWSIPIPTSAGSTDQVNVNFTLETSATSYGQAIKEDFGSFDGIVAFFPVATRAKIECQVTHDRVDLLPVLLSAPSIVSLYTESHVLRPRRDFLSNPQDSITFTGGMITGHKYVGQSPAKTLVDTITAPIRSIMPSVTVTQSVAVSPTGKTTTTSTQTGPPKGP